VRAGSRQTTVAPLCPDPLAQDEARSGSQVRHETEAGIGGANLSGGVLPLLRFVDSTNAVLILSPCRLALSKVRDELTVVANVGFKFAHAPPPVFPAAAEWARISCRSSSSPACLSRASATLPCHSKCFTLSIRFDSPTPVSARPASACSDFVCCCEFSVAVHHMSQRCRTISDCGTLMKSANALSLSATDSGRRKLMGLRISLGRRLNDRRGVFCYQKKFGRCRGF
jgi:hypothetical protein